MQTPTKDTPTMSNPNFVNDLVMMAKAFEELPQVKDQLSFAQEQLNAYAEQVQRLELKLVDRANEIDTLNASVRKAEVERDHAETMFLETDDRLNAFRRLVSSFQTEVAALDKASQPEPVAAATMIGASEAEGANLVSVSSEDHIDGPFPYTKASDGGDGAGAGTASEAGSESAADPTAPAQSNEASLLNVASSETASGMNAETQDNASSVEGHRADPLPQSSATTPTNDVGYHNEPDIGSNDWLIWYERMNARYGDRMLWPERPATIVNTAQT